MLHLISLLLLFFCSWFLFTPSRPFDGFVAGWSFGLIIHAYLWMTYMKEPIFWEEANEEIYKKAGPLPPILVVLSILLGVLYWLAIWPCLAVDGSLRFFRDGFFNKKSTKEGIKAVLPPPRESRGSNIDTKEFVDAAYGLEKDQSVEEKNDLRGTDGVEGS